MLRRVCGTSLVLLALAPLAAAQELADSAASRGPRFLLVAALHRVPVDVSRTPVLRKRLSLDLGDVPLKVALAAIAQRSGLDLVYSDDVLPVGARVSLRAEGITVAAALTDVLTDADVDVVFSRNGRAALVPRAKAGVLDSGSVRGRVTDAKSGQPIAGASVVLVGTRWRGVTDNGGEYRLAEVASGTYTVTASRIGYARQSQPVTVVPGQEVAVDLALRTAPTELEQVVVTGTVVPTEVKALPMPVSVISDSDVALQRPRTVQELFRQAVPTAVSWDFAAYPYNFTVSVRGTSSLNGLGQMKVILDGIPLADFTSAAVDPNSIARMEVIRGPQAAAIYGSDAIGGVIQIFTKRGDATFTRPRVDVQASLGKVQTPYSGYDGVLHQSYLASLAGGGSDVSYNFGAGYTHTPDWSQPVSEQSNTSIYGGVHVAHGMLTADVTGRSNSLNNPQVFNPDLVQTGFFFYSKPEYEPVQVRFQTLGARLSLMPTPWLQHTLTIGVDRIASDGAQTQARRTTPSDTLLTVFSSDAPKTSIGFNTSVQGALRTGVTGSLTAGFDHYSYRLSSYFTSGAVNTTGAIVTDPNRPVSAYQTITTNTGYFVQGQLSFRDALFLTGGLRAERNSDFGDSLGTPVSPQGGVSYVHALGNVSVKVRGSWGRAIRPPVPGSKAGSISPVSITLANPGLAPERQQGWDAGMDAVFGARGSLSVTYYHQTAENLIQLVLVQSDSVSTYQNQNVGRVKNAGVEVEGAVSAGLLKLKAQYGYVRSRIEDLGPNYTGSSRVGDRPFNTPTHTAGASLTVAPVKGPTVAGGLTYVGSYNQTDLIALFSCFGRTGPCRSGGSRSYIVAFPSFVKVNATISQRLTSLVSGFVSVDNLTNDMAHEPAEIAPVTGRTTTIGFQFHY